MHRKAELDTDDKFASSAAATMEMGKKYGICVLTHIYVCFFVSDLLHAHSYYIQQYPGCGDALAAGRLRKLSHDILKGK
jgi:hypothetical protein